MMRNESRHDAAGQSGMLADGEHPHRDGDVQHPAQAAGQPEPLVVPAVGVEAHHQGDLAQPTGQVLQVGGQVWAAGLLARLQQQDRPAMAAARGPHGRMWPGQQPVTARRSASWFTGPILPVSVRALA